jgi:hypothetical protein
VEECTYFWGVNASWGINMAESKRPLNQEDNQAPQPTDCGSGFKDCMSQLQGFCISLKADTIRVLIKT